MRVVEWPGGGATTTERVEGDWHGDGVAATAVLSILLYPTTVTANVAMATIVLATQPVS